MDREEWITSKEAFEWGFSTTQTRKDNVMQSLEADFVYNLVMKNKELQKTIEEKAKEKPIGLNNQIKEDAWTSFFNTKNQEKEGKKDEN